MPNLVVTEAPLRLAEEQLCPDSAFLVGDDDFEEPSLILLYREAA